MKSIAIGFGIAAVLAAAVAFPLGSRAASPADLWSAFQATQRMTYREVVERVEGGDGPGPAMFVMVTDPRDVAVLGSSRDGFWHGETNRPLPNAPEGYRVFGGYFGNYMWGLVTDSQGEPISQAWFFGTRENGRFHIWNFFGNRASGVWFEF